MLRASLLSQRPTSVSIGIPNGSSSPRLQKLVSDGIVLKKSTNSLPTGNAPPFRGNISFSSLGQPLIRWKFDKFYSTVERLESLETPSNKPLRDLAHENLSPDEVSSSSKSPNEDQIDKKTEETSHQTPKKKSKSNEGQKTSTHANQKPSNYLLDNSKPAPAPKVPSKTFFCGSNFSIGFSGAKKTQYVYVWGDNSHGQLGLGDSEKRKRPHLLSPPSDSPWIDFICGENFVIGMTLNGTAYGWGENSFYQLGLGDSRQRNAPALLHPPKESSWKSFACGQHHVLALTEEGEAYVWGWNEGGILGVGDREHRGVPHLLPPPKESPWQQFACGYDHSFGVTREGEVYVWGSNKNGQLGIGEVSSVDRPHLLPPPKTSPWSHFYCGHYYSLGVTEEGEVYVWGDNSCGQLGVGNRLSYSTPQLLSPPKSSPWTKFFCGGNQTIGMTKDEETYMWGWNSYDESLKGDSQFQTFPHILLPPKESPWKSFACGDQFTIGLTEEGEGYVWGWNGNYPMGLGHNSSRKGPQLMRSPRSVSWYKPPKEPRKVVRLSSINLSKMLGSGLYSDVTIGEWKAHSPLVKVRCPLLLQSSSLLSLRAVNAFVPLLYGSTPSPSVPAAVWVELYHFIRLHQLSDFEMEVFVTIEEKLKEKEDLLQILKEAEECGDEEIQSMVLAAIPLLPAPLTKEELDSANASKKFRRQLLRIGGEVSRAPKIMKETPKNMKGMGEYLKQLLHSEEGADFTILLGKEHVKAHRFILMVQSSYFEHLFLTSSEELSEVDLTPSRLSRSSMKSLLEYFYTEQIPPLTLSNSFELLRVKNFFSLEGCTDLLAVCQKNVERPLTGENCLEILQLAHKWEHKDLFQRAMEVTIENFERLTDEREEELLQLESTLLNRVYLRAIQRNLKALSAASLKIE